MATDSGPETSEKPRARKSTPPPDSTSATTVLHCSSCGCQFGLRAEPPPGLVCAFCDTVVGGEADSNKPRSSELGYLYGVMNEADVASAPTAPADGSEELARAIKAAPASVGRYRILAELGRGGMGIVYRAWEPTLERVVALKVLPDDAVSRSGEVDRFFREARLVARLDHDNIVKVHEIGSADGRVFFAMELVEGPSLAEVLKRRKTPLSRAEAIRLTIEIARALDYAHAANMIHRDVKPGNVLLDVNGKTRLTDYGLAVDTTSADRLTVTGQIFGTPAYMAPEQARGAVNAGPEADIYALGGIFFELLTGELPYKVDNQVELIGKLAAGEQPRNPRAVDPRIPPDIDVVCSKALSVEPKQRYRTAGEFADDLERFVANKPIVARRPSLGYRARRFATRNQRSIAVALGALMLAGLAVVGVVEFRRHGERAKAEEREQLAAKALDTMEREIESLVAEGRTKEAENSFEAFVSLDSIEGTEAMGRAWLGRAKRKRERGDLAGERLALAQAFTFSAAADLQEEALTRIAELFARQWQWSSFGVAVSSLEARGSKSLSRDPLKAFSFAAALAGRDFERASALARDPKTATLLEKLSLASKTQWSGIDALFDEERGYIPVDGELVEVALDPPLSEIRRVKSPQTFVVASTGGLVLFKTLGTRESLLFDVASGTSRIEWESTALALESADTDGDGASEIYVGLGPYDRELVRLDRHQHKAWTTEVVARSPRQSDVFALGHYDFDGDGRDELIVGGGPWFGYDVRVVGRQSADSKLETLARLQLGTVRYVDVIETKAGPRIVAVKVQKYPSALAFGRAKPHGADPGVYVLRFDRAGGKLVVEKHYPPTEPNPDKFNPGRFASGDFDGDGLTDLVYTTHVRNEAHSTLWHQHEGGFESLDLGGLYVLGAQDADGDGDTEIFAQVRGSPGNERDPIYVLGLADGQRLASRAPPLRNPSDLEVPSDPNGLWRRALELESQGLLREPAEAYVRIARAEPTRGSAARLRAAALFELAGLPDRAVAEFEEAAREPSQRRAALRGALRIALAQYDLDGARRFAERLVAVSPDDVDRLRWLTDLATAPRVDLDFSRALEPTWNIKSPSALFRNPRSGVLAVYSIAVDSEIASFPVQCDGGVVSLDVRGRVTRSEWATGVSVSLRRPDSQQPVVGAGTRTVGGGRLYNRDFGCSSQETFYVSIDREPLATLDQKTDFRVWSVTAGQLPMSGCRTSIRGESANIANTGSSPAPPGAYELVISSGLVRGIAESNYASLELERVSILGCSRRLQESPPMAKAHHQLLEGDSAAALALLAGGARTADEFGAAILAALEVGDTELAAKNVRGLVKRWKNRDSEAARVLAILIRARAAGPLIRDAVPDAYVDLIRYALTEPLSSHPSDGGLANEVGQALGGLDLGGAAAEARGPVALARGRASWRKGSEGRARADLKLALDATLNRIDRAEAHYLMVQIELADGDGEAALVHALAFADLDGNAAQRLRALDTIDRVAGQPEWDKLLGTTYSKSAPK